MKETFPLLDITGTTTSTNLITVGTATTGNLFLNQPVEFIPTYYKSTITDTAYKQLNVIATTGGSDNTLLFESTASDARMVAVEYFIAKDLARKNVPLVKWNRNFHDHQVEIDTGRVAILDIDDPKKVQALAEAAGKTDGVIFHLWGKDQVVPDGTVTIPTSLGHVYRTK